jgi:hypothetical protein
MMFLTDNVGKQFRLCPYSSPPNHQSSQRMQV